MKGMNKVILYGRVVTEPRFTEFQNGGVAASFFFETPDEYVDKTTGQRRDISVRHSVSVTNPILADVVKSFVAVGTVLLIEGMLKTTKYTDKKTGQEKYITQVCVSYKDSLTCVTGMKSPVSATPEPVAPSTQNNDNTFTEANNFMAPADEIPF